MMKWLIGVILVVIDENKTIIGLKCHLWWECCSYKDENKTIIGLKCA